MDLMVMGPKPAYPSMSRSGDEQMEKLKALVSQLQGEVPGGYRRSSSSRSKGSGKSSPGSTKAKSSNLKPSRNPEDIMHAKTLMLGEESTLVLIRSCAKCSNLLFAVWGMVSLHLRFSNCFATRKALFLPSAHERVQMPECDDNIGHMFIHILGHRVAIILPSSNHYLGIT